LEYFTVGSFARPLVVGCAPGVMVQARLTQAGWTHCPSPALSVIV
jgi:hypothetical protein